MSPQQFFYRAGVSVGGGGSGVSVGGSGTGVSVGASVASAVPVTVMITTAVFVGLGVRVDVGKMTVGGFSTFVVAVRVGLMMTRVAVLVAVGENVQVGLGVNVSVGVPVATNLANASAVCAAAVFKLENARLGISRASITMGVGRFGSERAMADVAQNMLNPNMLAAKIHKSPA